MEDTPGWAFYKRQVAYLETRDIDGLMTHYHDDAEMVGFDFKAKGREAIRQRFESYLKSLGSFKVKSTERFAETEDTILLEATVVSGRGEARVYNAFVLKDGKVTHQFSGTISVSPR